MYSAMRFFRAHGLTSIAQRDWQDLGALYAVRNRVVHDRAIIDSKNVDQYTQLRRRFPSLECPEPFFTFRREFNTELFAFLADLFGKSEREVRSLTVSSAPPVQETEEEILKRHGLERDPVIEEYKKDVDRTLLRQNLMRTLDERLQNIEAVSKLANEFSRAGVKAHAG